MRGHPKRTPRIIVSPEEDQLLQQLICAPQTPQKLVLRARIILALHAHPEQTNQQIAALVGTTDSTVSVWRKRWMKTRQLSDLPRRGASRLSSF